MQSRRSLLLAGVGLVAAVCSLDAAAGPRARHRRRVRRRVRRHIRRRYRRRVVVRTVLGRPVWVVPVGVAVGWELAIAADRAGQPDQIVVVQQIKTVEVEGKPVQVVVVAGPDGKTREMEVVKEDTPENSKELEGSVLAEADAATPHLASEVEVEEEVDE